MRDTKEENNIYYYRHYLLQLRVLFLYKNKVNYRFRYSLGFFFKIIYSFARSYNSLGD
jgi:hypothetical protein